MTTDTSERGLERLICAALTGSPCEPGAASGGTVREPRPEYGGSGWVCGDPDDYDREHCVDSAQLAAFLRATQPEAAETFDLGADSPARRRGRTAPRRQARAAPRRPLLRLAVARQSGGGGALRGEPFLGDATAPLQRRRAVARARRRAVRQRPAGGHVRAQEQPHQADGRRRRAAVPARPRPARAALRARPLRRPLRGGRARGALLHPPAGEGVVVPAVQPGLERRRGKPAERRRAEDRLPLAADPDPGRADRNPGALRADRRDPRRADAPEDAPADLAPPPPARRGAPAPGRRGRARSGPALPGPALCGERQVELHRLAGAPAHRHRTERRARLRLDRGRHRPPHPRPADPRHDPAVRPGRRDGRPRCAVGRPAPFSLRGEADHRLHGAEVPDHPGRHRQRAPAAEVRHRHRRGAFQPGRADLRIDVGGARRRGSVGRRRHTRRPAQPDHGVPETASERELLRVHRHAQEPDAEDLQRAAAAAGRRGPASALPQLHHEAGD